MRSILITNDDGIEAEGLWRLVKAAKHLGQIWVVAPEHQRSAASHSITLREPLDVYPVKSPVDGVKAFSCSGMPSDCVRVGGLGVMPVKPDLVLSGINYGYNVASDVQYSATVGAALEGAFQGWLSAAFSEGIGGHEITDAYLTEALDYVAAGKLAPGEIYNVNFSDRPLAACKGILKDRLVSEGMVYKDHYDMIEELDGGGKRYMVRGVYTPEAEEGTDYRAVLDGYVSIGIVRNVS